MILSQIDGNALLSQINFAGTHDSCTAFVSMESMARCQSLTVTEQLRLGIRLFDIRLNRRGDEFYLIHSLADCYADKEKKTKLTFGNVLCDFEKFLCENPDETLVISIKQDRGIMSRFFFPAFYDKYIKGNEEKWYLKNEDPCLSSCRGKMVLMRRCKVWKNFLSQHDAGLDFSYWKDQSGLRKTGTEKVILSAERKLIAEVQDRYSLDVPTKWKKSAKPFLQREEKSDAAFRIHFLSTSYRKKGETLYETAREMNAYFMAYDLRKDRAQGWFFFDFPTRDIVEKINSANRCIYFSETEFL